MNLNRRTLLTTASAASAAAMLGTSSALSTAAAQTAPAGKQAPAFYRYKIGSFEVTSVNDGVNRFPLPDTFVRNAKKEEVQAALADAYLPTDVMTIWFNPTLINTGSRLILIDTGLGDPKGPIGHLRPNLAAAGIDPKAIDTVIISHFHADHINGIRNGANELNFPNAEIMVPNGEWDFWMSDDNMNKAPEAMKGAFGNVRRVFKGLEDKVKKYNADQEIAPGLTTIATPGHTPGHISYALANGNDRVLIQSDVTNNPHLFVKNPGWHVQFDMNGPEAEATRRKFYDMAAADKLLVAGFHFPFPATGYVEKVGTGYRLVPVSWNPAL
jgi:glyoxylase-like metal-dependent hydrolase (beta-lactamase superfamily II)